MVSQSKLIKKGINYSDALFDEIINRLQNGVNSSDTLEEFLVNNQEYTSANPLVSSGYQDTMINLVLSETNNHRFSRPSQRELTRVAISEQLGTLISNVGEEVKQTIRDIVTEEYGRGSNPQLMAKRFSTELGSINKRRARVIARTEIARTSTISDYIISKEQGATHYTVSCRSTRCSICKDLYCNTSETGGDVEFSIDDTEHLPPLHPNCRCVADFYKKKEPKSTEPQKEDSKVQPVTGKEVLKTSEDYEEYTATDNWYKRKVKGRKYSDGTDIRWDDSTDYLNADQVKKHLESLPQILQEQARKYPIYLEGGYKNRGGSIVGEFHDHGDKFISLYKSKYDIPIEYRFDTITHELAHSLEPSIKGSRMKYSNSDLWRNAFKEDNKFNSYINERTGRKRTPKVFSTEYSQSVYKKRHKIEAHRFAEFSEDWADSWKLYSNPSTRKSFVEKFPNRTKIIEDMIDKFEKNYSKVKKTTKVKSATKKTKAVSKPKTESIETPLDKGKNAKTTNLKIGDEYGYEDRLKEVKYKDGTTIKFKTVESYEGSNYYQQTVESIKYNGKTYTYQNKNAYKHFDYQDMALSVEDRQFCDEFASKYGTYDGKLLNNYNRGKLSKSELQEHLDHNPNFKWLLDNQERYNQILRESKINGNVVTVRTQAKNMVPSDVNTIKDNTFTSSSAGADVTTLEDDFAIGKDSWKYMTIVQDGAKGGKFAGNSIRRYNFDDDADFELEITWAKNQEFDILIKDEKNKIMLLKPKGAKI